MTSEKWPPSEDKSQCKLHVAGTCLSVNPIVALRAYSAESCAGDRLVGKAELHAIEGVVHLPTKHQLRALGDFEILCQGCVPVILSGGAKGVPCECALIVGARTKRS